MNTEQIFWAKMEELFRLLETDPPERGTKLEDCIQYVEKAIDRVWILRDWANLPAPGFEWEKIDNKWVRRPKTI